MDLRTVHESYIPFSYEHDQGYGNSWGSARNRGEKAFISHQGNHTEVDIRNWIFFNLGNLPNIYRVFF